MHSNPTAVAVSGHLLSSDEAQSVNSSHVRKADIGITPARLRAFLSAIEKPAGEEGCWIWRRSLNSTGYASGSAIGLPHRMAYVWMVGPIPAGLELDHLCRNRACVNPHHLEPVTHRENIQRSKRPVETPLVIRRYCRRGHVLDSRNGREWRNGNGQRTTRCYLCHDGPRVLRDSAVADA